MQNNFQLGQYSITELSIGAETASWNLANMAKIIGVEEGGKAAKFLYCYWLALLLVIYFTRCSAYNN